MSPKKDETRGVEKREGDRWREKEESERKEGRKGERSEQRMVPVWL